MKGWITLLVNRGCPYSLLFEGIKILELFTPVGTCSATLIHYIRCSLARFSAALP